VRLCTLLSATGKVAAVYGKDVSKTQRERETLKSGAAHSPRPDIFELNVFLFSSCVGQRCRPLFLRRRRVGATRFWDRIELSGFVTVESPDLERGNLYRSQPERTEG
jgi:hypothetical protein